MRLLIELIRVGVIIVSSALIAFGALVVADYFRIFHPYKALFFGSGAAVAIAFGVVLQHAWPSRYKRGEDRDSA